MSSYGFASAPVLGSYGVDSHAPRTLPHLHAEYMPNPDHKTEFPTSDDDDAYPER